MGGRVAPEYCSDQGLYPITTGEDLVGTAASQKYTITDPNSLSVRLSVTVAGCRVKFGTSSVSVTTTTGIELQNTSYDVLRIPVGATHMAYIGDGANINIIECR